MVPDAMAPVALTIDLAITVEGNSVLPALKSEVPPGNFRRKKARSIQQNISANAIRRKKPEYRCRRRQ